MLIMCLHIEEIVRAYSLVGDIRKALEYAEKGLELTRDENLLEKVKLMKEFEEYALEVGRLSDAENYPKLADWCYEQKIKAVLCGIAEKAFDELDNGNYFYYLDPAKSKNAVVIYETPQKFYVYCGDYGNLEREGEGTWFGRVNEEIYEVYRGRWKDDEPNGAGRIIRYDVDEPDVASKVSVRKGDFVNRLMDGAFVFENEYNEDGVIREMQAYFNKGVAKDRTKEFISACGYVDISQDEIIVTFEENSGWRCRAKEGANWGVLGFR